MQKTAPCAHRAAEAALPPLSPSPAQEIQGHVDEKLKLLTAQGGRRTAMRVELGGSPTWYLSSAASVHACRGAQWVAWACRDSAEVVSFSPDGKSPTARRTLLEGSRVVGVCFVDDDAAAVTENGSDDMEDGEVAVDAPVLAARLAVATTDGHVSLWHVEQGVRGASHAAHGKSRITSITCSASLVVSGDKQGQLALWPVSGDSVASPTLHEPQSSSGGITALSLSVQDRHLLAVGYASGNVLLVRLSSSGDSLSALQRLRGHEDEVQSLAWHAGLLASGARDRTLRVWSPAGAKSGDVLAPAHVLQMPREGGAGGADVPQARVWVAASWTRGGDLLCGSFGGTLLRWSGLDGEGSVDAAVSPSNVASPTAAVNATAVNVAPPAKKGKKKAAKAAAAAVSGGRLPRRLPPLHSRTVFAVCTSRNDDLCLTMSMDRQVALWDLSSERAVWRSATLGGFAYALAASPADPSRLAVACGDQTVHILRQHTHEPRHSLEAPTVLWRGLHAKATALAWHPTKESLLAVGTADGALALFDVANGRPAGGAAAVHVGTVSGVVWLPYANNEKGDGGSHWRIATCGADGAIKVSDPGDWDAPAENWLDTVGGDALGRTAASIDVLCLPENVVLVGVGFADGSWAVIRTSRQKRHVAHHVVGMRGSVHRVSWRPVNQEQMQEMQEKLWFAVATDGGAVSVIQLDVPSDSADGDAACLPTGASDGRTLSLSHTAPVHALAWSPHVAPLLATGAADGAIRVWDTVSATCRHVLRGHIGRVLCVTWSDLDDDALWSGGDDQTVRSWRCTLDAQSGDDAAAAVKVGENAAPTVAVKRARSAAATSARPEKRLRSLLPLSKTTNEPRKTVLSSVMHRADTDTTKNSLSSVSALGLDVLLDANRDAIATMLSRESAANAQNGGKSGAEMALALRLYSGDAEGAAAAVVQSDAADMDLMLFAAAVAPSAGSDVWEATAAHLAAQYEAGGETHRAAMLYIALHRPEDAVQVYRRASLLRYGYDFDVF